MSLGGSSSRGPTPEKKFTGFRSEDLEKLRSLGGGMANMSIDLDKFRPKLAEVGEGRKKVKRRTYNPSTKSYEYREDIVRTGMAAESLVEKEAGGDEIQRLMGLFRKRQQEVIRGKAAPGRKALRAQGTGDY
tara:strand:+ start:1052 stop:1447 length:396 start_codon:yes stop_codon:yes gene_type:complete